MYFLVDSKNKTIFGWSAKCGCSHMKRIYWFLQTGKVYNQIHRREEYLHKLPNDIKDYTTIIITRNPYKRIVSGFLDKYKKSGSYRHRWKDSYLSFSHFVEKVVSKDWKTIDQHHFTQQTTENFNKQIFLSKNIKFYDIEKIDYEYIEQLYNKKIPPSVINQKGGHERKIYEKTKYCYVYDLHIDDYIDHNIDIRYFYNKEIKEKVYNFYMNDFIIFKENGIDYTDTELNCT